MDSRVYFDDLVVGETVRVGPYRLEAEEMMAFARAWDPLPMHLDEEAGRAAGFGGITTSGPYVLALAIKLMHRSPRRAMVIASFGYDELRFLLPGRPGDDLTLDMAIVEARPSRSKPDRGIVRFRATLINQRGEAVLNFFNSVLIRRRTGVVAPE